MAFKFGQIVFAFPFFVDAILGGFNIFRIAIPIVFGVEQSLGTFQRSSENYNYALKNTIKITLHI